MKRGFFIAAALLMIFGFTAVPNRVHAEPAAVNASSGVSLSDLANQGLIKLRGRTVVKNGYLDTHFSGTGFEFQATVASATQITLTYDSSVYSKIGFIIDGDETVVLNRTTGSDRTAKATIPAGTHEVIVVKESQITTGTPTFKMKTIQFNGTVDKKLDDRDIYFEVIGDSYSCGDGAVGKYAIGKAWTSPDDDAVTSSFGHYLATMLGADYSVVGRGGIGLDGTNMQESGSNTVTMPMLYKYASYTDRANGVQYDFQSARVPDFVVIELGANDSNSSSNAASWTGYAKNLILQVKEVYGDVPIIWEFTGSKSWLFTGLRNLAKTDAQLSVYDNLYFHTNYFNRNGSAALKTQSGGHPDSGDQYAFAERLYNFIDTDTFILEAPEDPKTEIVYYVSESGNDSNDGLTPETALKTCPMVLKKYTNKTGSPADAELVIKVTGTVVGSTKQGFMDFDAGSRYYRTDGTPLPVVIETYQYDGTNRATIKQNSKPSNGGSAHMDVIQPFTFRNVKIWCAKGTSSSYPYSINNLHASGNRLVLDNVIAQREEGGTLNLSAAGQFRRSYLEPAIAGTAEALSEVVLLNGTYDSTTGFGYIAANPAGSLYASGNSAYSAPGLTCKITVGKGAIAKNVNLVRGTFAPKEAVVEVTTGGVIEGYFAGSPNSSAADTRNTYNTDVRFLLSGGKVHGYFWMLGRNATVNGDVTFEMTGGEIHVPPFTNTDGSIIALGAGWSGGIVTGDVFNDISGGLFLLEGGNYQTSPFFAGYSNVKIQGSVYNTISAGTFMVIQGEGYSSPANSGLYLGMMSGCIQTELVNEIKGGLFDQTRLGDTYYFGGQSVSFAIRAIRSTIGEEAGNGRNVGPVFLSKGVSFAAGWGQFGVSTYTSGAAPANQACSDEVVVSTLVLGGQFDGNVYCTPTGATNTTNGYWPRTIGSEVVDIENGDFLGTTYLASNNGDVYGHVLVTVNGGRFKGVYGTAWNATGVIHDGLEIHINDFNDFGALYSSTTATEPYCMSNNFAFWAVHNGTVKATTPGRTAFTFDISGGTFLRTVNVASNGGTVVGDVSININDGYFKTVTGNTLAKNYINGGYFVNEPAADLIEEGYKAAAEENTNAYPFASTYDPMQYHYIVREKLNCIIEVASETTEGGVVTAIAPLSGGGTYLEDSPVTLTATEVPGYLFKGWYLSGAQASPRFRYETAAVSDATYVAKYEVRSAGFEITVDAAEYEFVNNGVASSETGRNTFTVQPGDPFEIRYAETDFDGWINASGKLFSRENPYAGTASNDMGFKLQTKGSTEAPTVIFYTAYNQVLQTVKAADLTALPAVPVVIDKVNPGSWSLTLSEIQTKAANGTPLIPVVATYLSKEEYYVVTIKSVFKGTDASPAAYDPALVNSVPVEDRTTEPTAISEAVEITPEELSGYAFQYFAAADGTILSYDTLKLRLKADMTIYAVYDGEPATALPTVSMVTAMHSGSTIYFEAARSLPDTATVVEQGILFTTKDLMGNASMTDGEALIAAENALVVQGTLRYQYASSGKQNVDVTGLTLKNVSGLTVYARGYVVYMMNGEEGILLSDVVSETAE